MLTKTRSILRYPIRAKEEVFWSQADHERVVATLTVAAWEEMGSPDVVTVTVEPGDLLNED